MRRLGWSATARLAALSAVLLVASAGTAAAATNPAGPPVLCPSYAEVVKGSAVFVREQEHFGYGPDWRVESISDGQTGSLSLTRVVSTSNTWSVTGGVKGSVKEAEVSAVVGFSVSKTEGFNATKTLNLPAEAAGSKVWFIEAGTKDRVTSFKVQVHSCGAVKAKAPFTGQAIERGPLIYRVGSYARQP
jgi:hypothetical protein